VLLLSAPFDPSWYSLHVGASGALFGLLGVVLTPTRALDRNWGGAAVFLVINVVYSLITPGISWESHAGGLVVGFALGCAALLPRGRGRRTGEEDPPRPQRLPQVWFWIAAAGMVATMLAASVPGLRASFLLAG
jgi:membrane associated rhomboid family serine protease